MDNIINGWEYKETVTKSGKTIVFGKLDELLKSYYKVSTVDSLAPFRSSYKEQYIINYEMTFQKSLQKSIMQ